MTTSKSVRTDQAALEHRALQPFDQSGPHCTDQDERMLFHVLDLQELPDHEELQRRADAARHDDECGGEADEVVQAREEGAVAENLVHERVGGFLGGQVDGQAERARLAALPLHRARVRRFHQSRPAAGDDVHAHPRQLGAQLLDFFVDRIAAPDARAAEDRDAVVLDALGLDLVEIVDRLPELVDGLVEDVRRIGGRPLLRRLRLAQLLELGRGGFADRARPVAVAIASAGECHQPVHCTAYFAVIHTSFENSRSFGSAARASASESKRTRTR